MIKELLQPPMFSSPGQYKANMVETKTTRFENEGKLLKDWNFKANPERKRNEKRVTFDGAVRSFENLKEWKQV